MDNSSLKTSSYSENGNSQNGNRIYLAPSLSSQFLPRLEEKDEDWNLRQFLSITKRRSLVILGVMIAVMTTVIAVTLKQESVYESKFRILAEPVNSNDNKLPKLISIEDVDDKFNKSSLDYETQIQVLKSPQLMASVVKQLQVSYPEISYNSLIKSLAIIRLGETKIIQVTYHSHDPTKIKVVLDTLAQTYLKYSLENRQTNLRQGIQFVEKQLPPIKKRVDQIQQQMQIFRQSYNFIDPDLEAKEIGELINTLIQQRLAVNTALAKARSTFGSLQERQGVQVAVNSTPVYQQLITQYRQLETQTAWESTRFQEDSVPIQDLREKQQKLLPLIRNEAQRVWNIKLAEVAGEIQALQHQSRALAEYENKLSQKVKELPVLARQYADLQRDLQIANESLNHFLSTRQTLQIEAAQTQIPWQLIQAPEQPLLPVSPDIPRNLILGFVGSILLGISSALLIEKLDNTYHTVDAFKEKLKLPLLGTIPFDKQLINIQNFTIAEKTNKTTPAELFSQHSSESKQFAERVSSLVQDFGFYGSSKFLEAFRVLHTNIQLLSSDQPIRSIVISSALPEEGKSTVAFNLAQTASTMGQRVLLVDTDLRRPKIHNLLQINNLCGLSSIISGNTPVETVIQRVPNMNGLSVITSGPIPPDPTKLLSSQKMRQLMADFHKNYDLVIYDTPPLVGLADPSILASNTDGIMLVARINKTDRSALGQAIDSLKMTRSNILGMVINWQKSNSFGSYNYYY